jgi:hypothetical protein
MTKTVNVPMMPECDLCSITEGADIVADGVYNTPLNTEAKARFGANWANLCELHFHLYGVESSITEKRVKV